MTRSCTLALMVISCLMIGANATYGNVAECIDSHAEIFADLPSKNFFHVHAHDGEHANETANGYTDGEIPKGTILDKDESTHNAFLETAPEDYIKITLPVEGEADITLLLCRYKIFSEGATICMGDVCEESSDQGRDYGGIVEGHPDDSIAMCSLQQTEYSCMIQLGNEQFVLGNMGDTGTEILFRPKDQKNTPYINHYDEYIVPGAEETMFLDETPSFIENESGDSTQGKEVQMYIEVCYDIFEWKNKNEQAAREWVTAVMSEVFILFANEGVTLTIKSMKIWTAQDPYDPNDNEANLDTFNALHKGKFDGDIGHLLNLSTSGGCALDDVLCWKEYAGAVSGIDKTYSKAPIYSWTLFVIAHEIGHNLNLRHTHACVWGPGGDEPIDCCGHEVEPEEECKGKCNAPVEPTNGGTIMSFCEEINFSLGFGPQPAARMRKRIADAVCLTPEGRAAGLRSEKAGPLEDGDDQDEEESEEEDGKDQNEEESKEEGGEDQNEEESEEEAGEDQNEEESEEEDEEECVSGCPWDWIGDGVCDEDCLTEKCYQDDGDCEECAPGCPDDWIGDGVCDEVCMTEECWEDDGDCDDESFLLQKSASLDGIFIESERNENL